MKFITFGKIPQFNQVVRDVKRTAQFIGLDENNEPIIDKNAKLPKVTVEFTEKSHGCLKKDTLLEVKNKGKTPIYLIEKDMEVLGYDHEKKRKNLD